MIAFAFLPSVKVSYIVVPWPTPATGDEKLGVFAQHRERCRATPCKWSNRGLPCPAGKECLYDHSAAPQVPPHSEDVHRLEELEEMLDNDMLGILMQIVQGQGNVGLSDLDDQALEFLRIILEEAIHRQSDSEDR